MKSYVIHLIRNMPCEGNLEGRYIGRTESPLALESIAKLAQRKGELEYPQAQAFFASPSTRCVDTLKILYPQADPEVVLELAECDFGEFEGKTAKELEGDPRFAQWMAGGAQAAPPGERAGPVFLQRVCQGFELLVKNLMTLDQTSAVLVTSAGVLTSLLAAYGLPQAPGPPVDVPARGGVFRADHPWAVDALWGDGGLRPDTRGRGQAVPGPCGHRPGPGGRPAGLRPGGGK